MQPPGQPSTRQSIKMGKFGKYHSWQAQNGRKPHLFLALTLSSSWWRTTSVFSKNGRRPEFFLNIEDDFNYLATWKKKRTSISRSMEYDFNLKVNARQPQCANPSFSWAWLSSATACVVKFTVWAFSQSHSFYYLLINVW